MVPSFFIFFSSYFCFFFVVYLLVILFLLCGSFSVLLPRFRYSGHGVFQLPIAVCPGLPYHAFLFLFSPGQKFTQKNFFQDVFLPYMHYIFNLEIYTNSGKHEAEGTVLVLQQVDHADHSAPLTPLGLLSLWSLSFLPFRAWGLACLWQQVQQLRTVRSSFGSHSSSSLRPCSLPKPACRDCCFP